jgi:hypothetical protein
VLSRVGELALESKKYTKHVLIAILCLLDIIFTIFIHVNALNMDIDMRKMIISEINNSREIRLSGGPKNLTFDKAADFISRALASKFRMRIMPSPGSEENMERICKNEADMAIVHGHTYIPQNCKPMMVLNLFDNVLHILKCCSKLSQMLTTHCKIGDICIMCPE